MRSTSATNMSELWLHAETDTDTMISIQGNEGDHMMVPCPRVREAELSVC